MPRAVVEEEFLLDFTGRWHNAWNSRDPGQVVALCTNDVEWRDPTLPAPQAGHELVARSVRTLTRAMPDYRFSSTEPPLLAASRGKAVVPWRCEGTMTGPLVPPGFAPTNGPVVFNGDDHWEFRDPRICRCRVLYDANLVAVQIGAPQAHGSPGERIGVLLQRLTARSMRRRNR